MLRRLIYFTFYCLMFCVVNLGFGTTPKTQRNQLKIFEIKHPKCESQTLVETAKETFTTIANDLPGRNEYNELVKTFHRGQWEKLDRGLEEFENVFEGSPLREAVAFLRVESFYDRIESLESPVVKEAEKALRETLLLYPLSKLVPNIQATVGAFWLRNGQYSKSLALFLKAKEDNPFHPLACFFQFGVGENNFLLHEYEAAKKSFTALTQKCKNPRLMVGASLRLIEIEGDKSSGKSKDKLEALYKKESNIVRRFYPEALYNLGESKYQKGEFKSARFFFNEYLEQKHTDPECVPYAMKRLADVAAKLNLPNEELSGLYLQAYDKNQKTDIGNYAYVEAMLMDYPRKSRPEQERRTAVIDEKLSLIKDPKLRYLGTLKKGLALLEAGELGALDYLAKSAESSVEDLKSPEVSEFMSAKLVKILEKEADFIFAQDTRKEIVKNEELFAPFEQVYLTWIKGTPDEKSARNLYGDMITRRFKDLEDKGKIKLAFEVLANWKQSPVWSSGDPSLTVKNIISSGLASRLMDSKYSQHEELVEEIKRHEEILKDFIMPEFSSIFTAVFLETKDTEGVARWAKKIAESRKIANTQTKIPGEMKEFLALKKGEGYLFLKRFKDCEASVRDIRSARYMEPGLLLRIQSLQAMKLYPMAYKLGFSGLVKLPTSDSKIRVLSSLVSVVSEGKMWDKADSLLSEARKNKPETKVLAPFLYLVGKVQSERKNCKRTIASFNEAIAADSTNSVLNEAKFRMAKCYLKEKKTDQARKQWQEVADSKDTFWGPMAKSELNLMEGL